MTIVLDTTLDVSTNYAELIDRVTDGDSVYVRTKEALLAIFDDGAIDAGDKAQVLTQVMTQLNASVVTAVLDTALQWAAQEKQPYLQKVEAEYKLDLIKAQTDAQEADIAIGPCSGYASEGLNVSMSVTIPTGTETY